MLSKILAYFGYYKIRYGFSCGRHWMEINGKMIAQTPKDDFWLPDEWVTELVYVTVDQSKFWQPMFEKRKIILLPP